MKTPKIYSNNLKNHIITEDMLGACIYSVNKRAKNYRDYVHSLYADLDYKRSVYGNQGVQYQFQNINKAKAYRDTYYSYKDQLLSLVDPVSIHLENSDATTDTVRYYLFYRVGDYSFHRPLEVTELEKYPNLSREDIGTLTTYGHEIEDLISVQFVEKVLHLIRTNQYTLQQNRKCS